MRVLRSCAGTRDGSVSRNNNMLRGYDNTMGGGALASFCLARAKTRTVPVWAARSCDLNYIVNGSPKPVSNNERGAITKHPV